MPYRHPTLWESDYSRTHPNRQQRRSAARHGRTLPDQFRPRYPFPIDFLCDERLSMVLGVLVREAGITESEARVAAAVMAGYGEALHIAERLTSSQHTVELQMDSIYRKLGVQSRQQMVLKLWPLYAPFRPSIMLLPRLDPALLELEPDDECRRRLLRRIGQRDAEAAD